MSKFSFSQFQAVANKPRQTAGGQNNSFQKVGFFKLKNNGDEALVRFNISTLDDLDFAIIHTINANQRFMKVGCLNHIGTAEDNCPLCRAAKSGTTAIGTAKRRVYIKALVAYKDPTTGTFSEAIPVTWERPASFANTLAAYLRDYGDLKNHVFKITRNGAAGGTSTTYNISYIPLYDKPELVPTDFSAFNNFDTSRHDYWDKSANDMQTFLETGSFPEVATNTQQYTGVKTAVVAQPQVKPTVQPTVQPEVKLAAQSASQAALVQEAPVQQVAVEEPKQDQPTVSQRPARNFSGFSF